MLRALVGAAILVGAAAPAIAPARAAETTSGVGTRTIVLIRHGVYDQKDPRDPEVGKALTPQGQEQARLTGARLAHWPVRIDALWGSTMTRARQTATLIGHALGLEPRLSRDLRECTPPNLRPDVMDLLRPGEPDSCRQTLDQAWSRYFRPSADRDSTVVIVCHGNVIRYFVCRAIGLDPLRWLDMTIANCSLSVIQVRPDGMTVLVSFDDVGHLPPDMQGFAPRSDRQPSPK